MTRAKRGEVDRLMAAVEAANIQSGRSPLYRWLRRHHDELLARLDGERFDWRAFAHGFAKLGLTDRTGKAASPEAARKTWLRVRQDVAAARARKQSKSPPPLAPGEIAPAVRLATPPAQAPMAVRPERTPQPRPRLDIRPARALSDIPPAAEPEAPAPASPGGADGDGGREQAAEQIHRLREQMDARTVPLPKIV